MIVVSNANTNDQVYEENPENIDPSLEQVIIHSSIRIRINLKFSYIFGGAGA